MENEKIKIGLLGLIAVTLVINTYYTATKVPDTIITGGTAANSQPATNNTPIKANNANSNFAPATNVTQTASPKTNPINTTPAGPTTTISFKESSFDYGTIAQNTENKHIFEFINTGDEPLMITDAKGSCGCTVPKKPDHPILPGEKGEIEVMYKPGQKQGQQNQTVTLTANTIPPQTILKIKAMVDPNK